MINGGVPEGTSGTLLEEFGENAELREILFDKSQAVKN